MISLECALSELESEGSDIDKFVKDIFQRGSYHGSGHHSDTPPEDFVIQLLRYRGLEADKRRLIIGSCKEIYQDILDNFFDKQSEGGYQSKLRRLTRTIDIAQPPELEEQIRELFNRVLSSGYGLEEGLGAITRAFVGYAKKSDIEFVETDVLTNPNICAYGFNLMLNVNSDPNKIEKYLKELYQREYNSDWPVDCLSLTNRASKVLKDNNLPFRVLKDLKENNLIDWEKLSSDLQGETWSRKWLEQLVS